MGCSNGGVWAYLLRPAGHNNRNSKELRGKVKSSVDEETTGELRWEKPDARKGKEITEEYGKHNRTGNGENINRSTVLYRRGETRDGDKLRQLCGKMKKEKTGRKEGEKKLSRNTLRTRAGNRGGSVLRRGKN